MLCFEMSQSSQTGFIFYWQIKFNYWQTNKMFVISKNTRSYESSNPAFTCFGYSFWPRARAVLGTYMLLLLLVCLSLVINFSSNHFVMQQMPVDRWNKFELVVLSIDTLLYYKIPRLFQSDFIMLWNTCSKRFAMLYHTIQTSSTLITISKLSMECIS